MTFRKLFDHQELAAWMREHQWTDTALGARLGVTRQGVASWRTARCAPGDRMREALAALMAGGGETPPPRKRPGGKGNARWDV